VSTPIIYIDGQQAPDQGYAQDANNFYVWFTTNFSTHQVTIDFKEIKTQVGSLGPEVALGITVPEIILIYTVIAFKRLKRTPENA